MKLLKRKFFLLDFIYDIYGIKASQFDVQLYVSIPFIKELDLSKIGAFH